MMEKYIEYPHYTRPGVIEIKRKRRAVPKVLLSGNHTEIENWRKKESAKGGLSGDHRKIEEWRKLRK